MALRDNAKKRNVQPDTKIEVSDTVVTESASQEEQEYTGKRKGKKQKGSLKDNIKTANEKTGKAPKNESSFEWVKMWVSYLISMTMKDRGKIPDNIGDRILISNNMYITKLYMSTIVHIIELGDNTPETMIEVLNKSLREKGNQCILDVTCKNRKYVYDRKNSGLESRINSWESIVDSPYIKKRDRERAARLLYTVSVADSGKQLKLTRMFLTIRAKDVLTLNAGEKIIYGVLTKMGCSYLPAYSTIRDDLEYISMFGNRGTDLKNKAACMTDNTVLSGILPNCGSYNDNKGYYLGQNIANGSPYYLDTSTITKARNLYAVAPSGEGKTVLALNMAQSAFENGSAVCMMDIKGNEYSQFIKSTGGYIVSLRPTSTEFINSWVMRADDVDPHEAEAYFKSRINFSKQQIIILSGIKDREALIDLEELLDEFHDYLYTNVGAIPTNINSWSATEVLHPYYVFECLDNFLTPEKRLQYSFNKSTFGVLRMYMSATGSKSYIFKREFDYANILEAPTVSFDFGILAESSASDVDLDLFRLKFLYMVKLNGDFITRKYALGKRTFKVLEESQIVSEDIMAMYVKEFTLRRSQKQDTLLLGNSVSALMDNRMSKPLIENVTGLFVGNLTKEAREILMDQFNIRHLEELICKPGSSTTYKNSFLFINMMQDKKLYPIIKVVMDFKGGSPYKVMVPVKEGNAMAGVKGGS